MQDLRVALANGSTIHDGAIACIAGCTYLQALWAWVAAGFTGNGVGPTNMVGLSLASLALERSDDPTRLAFVDCEMPRIPPEPFHWIGGEAIRRGIEAKEEAELAGRTPGRLSSALARVPSSLLPVTFNSLLNPLHPEAARIRIAATTNAHVSFTDRDILTTNH